MERLSDLYVFLLSDVSLIAAVGFIGFFLNFAQFNEIIHRYCTIPSEIAMPAINGTGTAGTGFEIMYRNGFNNVPAFFALNSISNNSHKLTL